MPTPDFLEQVVISGRGRPRDDTAASGGRTAGRPSISAVVWALLDVVTAVLAGLIALRIRLDGAGESNESIVFNLAHAGHLPSLLMLVMFGVYLVLVSRLFGLYRPGDNFSGLHEQRMTMQAVLTSGLLLCGTLYLTRGY